MFDLKVPHCCITNKKKNSEAGFTLIELIIVSVLIAVFLSISIPTIRNSLYTDELRTTARKTIGTIQELRNEAVRNQQPYLLHFDLDKNSIWYEPDDGSEDPLDKEPETGLQFPESVRLVGVQARSQGNKSLSLITVWVSKRGYMDQIVVHMSDDEGDDLSLSFSPFSGSAKVSEGYVEIE